MGNAMGVVCKRRSMHKTIQYRNTDGSISVEESLKDYYPYNDNAPTPSTQAIRPI